jgi:Uma2 family endonuclease
MTPEEFDAITDYDDRYCYELIHRVLVVSPIPGIAEGDPNEELGHWLRQYRETHPQGAALDLTASERYVYLADSRRRADRLIWAGLGRLPDIEKDVSTIVAEFVSKGKRDRHRDYEEKRREYIELGVREYWVIDRFHRTMTVFKPGRSISEPEQVLVIPEDGSYTTRLLPGFELPLGRLLAVADRWR